MLTLALCARRMLEKVYRLQIVAHNFFIDDGVVNDFVETYYEHNVKDQVCNNTASLLGLWCVRCVSVRCMVVGWTSFIHSLIYIDTVISSTYFVCLVYVFVGTGGQ